MRYVTEINSSHEGQVSGIVYGIWQSPYDLWFVVHDTEDGKDRVVYCDKIEQCGCIGFWKRTTTNEGYAVVRHLAKMVNLYKYVKFARTSTTGSDVDFTCADTVAIGGSERSVHSDATKIAIDTGGWVFSVHGVGGSVVMAWNEHNDKMEVWSMYDLLSWLCKETGMSVLRYRKIQLYSPMMNYCTTVRLVHNKDSEVYFTKMYMDVMSS